ncbi:MAG: 16S rRNA (guanine(966)-N(2))-methyltransferase RsmD [Victivallales bacterium]|nr:16S rRNA (guanine(966)-N(2))-methyltransferase RsmD [Victivallales bacterium]
MRIISGAAGGIRLTAPDGRSLRPTEDRVKESMFASLGDIQGAVVVDLFSGTGALGLESLSRGASKVIMVEVDKRHVRYIEQNLQAVRKSMGGQAGQAEILNMDVRSVHAHLASRGLHADVVLADPPYHPQGKGAYGGNELLTDAGLLSWADQALLMLEHASDTAPPWAPLSPWQLIRTRTYGIRAVSFARANAEGQGG